MGKVMGTDEGQGSVWTLALRKAAEMVRAQGDSSGCSDRCIYRREATRQELARAADLPCLAGAFPSFLWQVWRNLSVSSKPVLSEFSCDLMQSKPVLSELSCDLTQSKPVLSELSCDLTQRTVISADYSPAGVRAGRGYILLSPLLPLILSP